MAHSENSIFTDSITLRQITSQNSSSTGISFDGDDVHVTATSFKLNNKTIINTIFDDIGEKCVRLVEYQILIISKRL